MKYYIEYPIRIRCNLKCGYCFHGEAFQLEKQGKRGDKYSDTCPFTPEEYMRWRDKHLSDGTEFLCELHGGEISHPANTGLSLNIIDTLNKERFQIQTNGLGDLCFYKKLAERKAKIDRIGFTFHRDVIGNNPAQIEKFINNVNFVKNAGINVYVKELLIPKNRAAIFHNKNFWESKGIEFRVQDFKGYRGRETKSINYTSADFGLIHSEYKHLEPECACRKGYKNVLIRGYDIFGGDVIACWNDPTVIGSIVVDWYNPNYKINRSENGINVNGVEKLYRGTYPRDMWSPEIERIYPNLTKSQLNKRSGMQGQAVEKRIEELKGSLQEINKELKFHEGKIDALQKEGFRVVGGIRELNELIKLSSVNSDKETPEAETLSKPVKNAGWTGVV